MGVGWVVVWCLWVAKLMLVWCLGGRIGGGLVIGVWVLVFFFFFWLVVVGLCVVVGWWWLLLVW